MELTKLIDYIPAIIVLVAVMILIIFVFKTQGDKIFDKESKTQNILIFIGGSLFIIVLIVHLFREQPWTADILKILIGILVGGSSAKILVEIQLTYQEMQMETLQVEILIKIYKT